MRVVGHGLRDELFVGGLPYAGPIGRTQRHGCQKRARMCGLGSKGWRILPPGRAKDPGANEGVEVREVVVPMVGLPAEAGKAGAAPHGTLSSAIVPAASENRLPVDRWCGRCACGTRASILCKVHIGGRAARTQHYRLAMSRRHVNVSSRRTGRDRVGMPRGASRMKAMMSPHHVTKAQIEIEVFRLPNEALQVPH